MIVAAEGLSHRKAEHGIEPFFLMRWSPRAMSGDEILDQDLFKIFEAGKWAPSSYNEQEWRFLYAKRNTPSWDMYFNFLVDGNKAWCKNAAALVVIVGSKFFAHNGKENRAYAFDCGAAFQNMSLQATSMNIVSHGMVGFDVQKVVTELKVPDTFEVLAMMALGVPASKETLPPELAEKEAPSQRRPISLTVCEGAFAFSK